MNANNSNHEITLIYTIYKSEFGSNIIFGQPEFDLVAEKFVLTGNYYQFLSDVKLIHAIKTKSFDLIKKSESPFGSETGFSISSDAIGCLNSYSKRLSIPKTVRLVTENFLKMNKFQIISTKKAIDVLIIIVEESVRQSGKSTMGSSLEEVISKQLISQGLVKLGGPRRDKINHNVEYDRIYSLKGFIVGMSSKRTMRERFRMNMADIKELEVDILLHCSLGFDLPVKQIEPYKGHLLIVPNDFEGEELGSDSVYPLSWVISENIHSYYNMG